MFKFNYLSTKFVLGIAIAIMLSACATPAPSASRAAPAATAQEITIKGSEYTFDAPARIEGGLVTIAFENAGKEPHMAQLARLNDGVTMEQLQGAMKQATEAAFGLVSFTGGAGSINPGGKSQSWTCSSSTRACSGRWR